MCKALIQMAIAKTLIRPVYQHGLAAVITLLRHLRGDHQGLIQVNPRWITHTVNLNDRTLKRNDMWHFGTVTGGDWDCDGMPVQEYGHVYQILKKRVLEGMRFGDIPEVQANLKRIEQGERPDVCSSKEEYRAKYQNFEKLYQLIKREGYQTQKELKSTRPLNEIRAQISREGNMLFEEGMHRLCITQLLKLEKVPVIITRCHRMWYDKTKSRLPRQMLGQ
jgi:hypothetical protein